MTPKPNPLPDTLSGLLEAACDDMNALDRERYVPNSLLWHNPFERRIDGRHFCEVCLGGAAMAGTLAIDPETTNQTADAMVRFGLHGNKIKAIDALRRGEMQTAAWCLKWHPDSIAQAMAFERREEVMEIRNDIAAVASFYTWQHWDNAEPRYRRLVTLLRTHGL